MKFTKLLNFLNSLLLQNYIYIPEKKEKSGVMIRRGYIIQECILVFLRGFGRSSLIFVRNSVFYGCVACHDLYPSVPPRFVSGFSRFRRFIFLACLIPKDDSDTFIVIVPRSPLTTGRLQFQDVITGFILLITLSGKAGNSVSLATPVQITTLPLVPSGKFKA